MRENVVYDNKNRIVKAGGIVINNDNDIVIYKADDSDCFSFPKGHLEPGETPEQCAHREVKEETGLDVVIIDYLPPMIYENVNKKKEVYIHMFLMKPLATELVSERKDDILLWVDYDTAVAKLKPSLKHYYKNYSTYLVENRSSIYRDKVLTEDGVLLKAGALVYRNSGEEWLLTFRKKWKDYSFPKGHLEPNEAFEEAAKRETLEESGCKIRIDRTLSDLCYEYPESGKVCVKMFLAECISQVDDHEDFEEPVWVSREDVVDTLTYYNLKEYFIRNVKDLEL